MSEKGTCKKHGIEFILTEGCTQCSAEKLEKLKVLKSLGTKELIEKMHQYEGDLETALREDASFKDLNYGYLASEHSDCRAVKTALAELLVLAPETSSDNKKLTEADKKAWLERQRTENPELLEEINKQKSIAFVVNNNQISTDMTKRRLEGTRAVLALKTQQLAFLAS